MLKHIVIALAAFYVLTLPAASQAQQILKAGINASGGPLSSHDEKSNTMRGVSVDLLTEIAKDAGFKIEFTAMALADLIPALNSNKIDIIAANLAMTRERQALVDFSEPFHLTRDVLVVAKSDAREYKSIEDLKGLVLGAQRGSIQQTAIQNTGLFPDVRLYDTAPDVIGAVNEGGISGGIIGATLAENQMQQGRFPNVRLVESYRPMVSSSVGFSVRKGDGELLRKINISLAKLHAMGTVKKIRARYGL